MKGKKMLKTFLVNKDTDLDQLGMDIIAESKKDNPQKIQLLIENAKTFKLSEIHKFSKIILKIPFEVSTIVLNDIDIKEFAFSLLCKNYVTYFHFGVKIYMGSHEPMSEEELERISVIISDILGIDAEVILEYCKNKDLIEPDMIYNEKNNN